MKFLRPCLKNYFGLLLWVLIGCGQVQAQVQVQDDAPITPYRPSVSSPAQLPAVGQLELEMGWLRVKQSVESDTRRDSAPYQFKLALNKDWGILLGGEAQVRYQSLGAASERGFGDTTLVLKHAVQLDEVSAWGFELGNKFSTAKTSIGSGKDDVSLNGIYSRDIGDWHLDLNANAVRLGLQEAGLGRVQKGLSASFSHNLSEHWAMNAELAATQRHGSNSTAQLLLAAVYSPHKRLSIDVGLIKGLKRGLNEASPDWALFSGVVFPVGRIF